MVNLTAEMSHLWPHILCMLISQNKPVFRPVLAAALLANRKKSSKFTVIHYKIVNIISKNINNAAANTGQKNGLFWLFLVSMANGVEKLWRLIFIDEFLVIFQKYNPFFTWRGPFLMDEINCTQIKREKDKDQTNYFSLLWDF